MTERRPSAPVRVSLKAAKVEDIDFIIALEHRDEHARFIYRWDREAHERALRDPDTSTVIFDNGDRTPVGYAILTGLRTPQRSIFLKRLAISEPGRGYGKLAMRALIDMAFQDLGAHRFWLDVFPDNERARRLYRAVGFVEEGVLRDAALQDGQHASLVIMSILEDEYRRGIPDSKT